MTTAEQKDSLGLLVGEYRLTRQLGKGTFGIVYLAEHLHDHSQTAVKLLELQLTGPDDFREFLNEARTIRLRHPHIISLLDFGLSRDDTPYLVMEYAVGGTLLQRYPRGTKLPLDRIDSYVSQLASALQYAHDHRVIHRDIKPENVLLQADGTLLLSDFGIAKMLGQSSIVNLQTQIGTPAYISPEQSRGKPCPASDQYSLAIMVYEWLVGQLPFQGNSFRVVLQHRQAVPPSLQTLNPEISIQAEKVVLQALAKQPEERFNTVQQFAQALHAALQESSSTVQTIQPNSVSPVLSPELRSGFPHPSKLSTLPSSGRQTLRPFQLTRLDEAQARVGRQQGEIPLQTSSPEETSRMAQNLHTLSSQIVPAQGVTEVPRSRNMRLLGRTILIASLFLVLLTGLVWGGRQTLLTQQRLSNSQHATATAQAATFATATAASTAYNTAVATHGAQFGFDLQHTHNNPYERIITPLNVKNLVQAWTAQTGNSILSSPAVANGVVYTSSSDGKLYAFKANGCGRATCAPLWKAQIDKSFAGSSDQLSDPIVANSMVYVSSIEKGKLYAFKADGCGQATCAPLWTAQVTNDGPIFTPVIANGVVYISSDVGKLYVFKADGCGQATCAPLWTAQSNSSSIGSGASPAVANGVVYISYSDGTLYVFKADGCGQTTCTPLWTAQSSSGWTGNGASPAVANGVVYTSSSDGKLYAFKADGCGQATCAPLWTAQSNSGPIGTGASPAVADGVVYISSGDGKLYVFKADGCGQATCTPLWTAQTAGGGLSDPEVANGVVYVGSQYGKLYAFKANGCGKATCAPLWTTQIGPNLSSPVVANGVVYVGSEDHKLYAFHL